MIFPPLFGVKEMLWSVSAKKKKIIKLLRPEFVILSCNLKF